MQALQQRRFVSKRTEARPKPDRVTGNVADTKVFAANFERMSHFKTSKESTSHHELDQNTAAYRLELHYQFKSTRDPVQFMAAGAIRRMQNLKLSQAWEKWQYEYEEQRRQMHMMNGALNRMRNLKLSQAWEKWQYEYEEQRRAMRLLNGALNRMRNLKLSQAWEKWQYEYELCLKAKGALFRMQHLQLSRAWEKWQYEYEELVRQMSLLRRGLLFMRHRLLARAWNKWRIPLAAVNASFATLCPSMGTGDSIFIPWEYNTSPVGTAQRIYNATHRASRFDSPSLSPQRTSRFDSP